ncbi:32655_t:CDS:1, partial [Racocetra persica]
IIPVTQGNYLTLNRERGSNRSTILYNASSPHKIPLWTCHEPTFVSLFHFAGFVNLAPNYLIFNSVGDCGVRDDLQISYFRVPLSLI